MDRLAEQVVAWHNRHPLAKRITIYDVHTIGVVALPFMRNAQADGAARQAGARGKVEPVLTDEVSPESLAGDWDEEGLTIAVNPNAAHLDALADQEPLPGPAQPSWAERFSRLAFWRKGSGAKSWPVFSERFVSHLSPRRIAAFALTQGYTKQPGDASWPQRVVPIDETLMGKGAADGGGAWPFELYLMSAAIDAGRSRSRILLGRGRQPAIKGRRCLSPQRLGLLALIVTGLLGAGFALLRPSAPKEPLTTTPVPAIAASAASAPIQAASSPTETASAAQAAPEASAPVSAPTDLPTPIDTPEPPTAPPDEPPRPDIRPMFVKPIPGRTAPPLGAPHKDEQASPTPEPAPEPVPEPSPEPLKPKAKSALAHASKPKLSSEPQAEPPAAAASKTEPKATPPSAKVIAKAQALVSKPVVALVGPVSADKTAAEATLAKMVGMLGPAQGGAGGAALQAQVFQTPEGWRPAVWPFASREEAQLINATLIARGMRTRAVDF